MYEIQFFEGRGMVDTLAVKEQETATNFASAVRLRTNLRTKIITAPDETHSEVVLTWVNFNDLLEIYVRAWK